jgi:hypothetical protein
MKINLIRNEANFSSDYHNLSMFPVVVGGVKTTFSDFINLDTICEDAEATEIRALDIIDYMSQPQIEKALNNWIKKLRHGGILKVGGVDLYNICRKIYQHKITVQQGNVLLRGDQTNPINFRKNSSCITDICGFLQSKGLKIIEPIMLDDTYIVVSQRH